MLWEYRVISVYGDTISEFPKECNGTDWELIAVVPAENGKDGLLHLFFKRPMTSALPFHNKGKDYYVTVNNNR